MRSENLSKINQLKELLANAKKIVFITGAGISTSAGIPDFRSKNGLYQTWLDGLLNTPMMLKLWPSHFYKKMAAPFKAISQARPSKAHEMIALLECSQKNVTVITQNVDGLHQAAGSTNVLELHGDLKQVLCMKCGKRTDVKDVSAIIKAGNVPHCLCGGVLRPTFTLFHEVLPGEPLRLGLLALLDADLVIVCGTSLKVSPVNKLPGYRVEGTPLVIINHAPTFWDPYATLVIHDDLDSVLEAAVM